MPDSSESNSALLDLIYGAVADPGSWSEVITRVSDELGAIGGLLAYTAPPGKQSFGIIGRLSQEYTEIYHRHYAWNPLSLALKDAPFEKAVIAGSLVAENTLARSAFYADALKPQGIVEQLATNHRVMTQDGGAGGFGFCFNRRGAERVHESARRLQRILPHLSRALSATLRFGVTDGTQLTYVLQLMPNPALLIDGAGRVTYANAAAEALCRKKDGLILDLTGNLQLSAALPSEASALSRVLAQAMAVAAGNGDELAAPMRLSRPSGAAPLVVMPIPLPRPALALWQMSSMARVLVLIVDPTAQSRTAAATVQAVFNLTAAEARVAVLIGGGLSGPQAASVLGISPTTVKTHLKRCFDKMGIHSQVALARLLGALPVDPANTNGLS